MKIINAEIRILGTNNEYYDIYNSEGGFTVSSTRGYFKDDFKSFISAFNHVKGRIKIDIKELNYEN